MSRSLAALSFIERVPEWYGGDAITQIAEKKAGPLRFHPRGSTGKRRAANTLFVSSVPFLQNRAERQRRAVSARTVRRYDSIIAENP